MDADDKLNHTDKDSTSRNNNVDEENMKETKDDTDAKTTAPLEVGALEEGDAVIMSGVEGSGESERADFSSCGASTCNVAAEESSPDTTSPCSSTALPPSSPHLTSSTSSPTADDEQPPTTFYVMCNKKKHQISFSLTNTVAQLKSHLESILGIPAAMQKLMFKAKQPGDDKLLSDVGISLNCKVMVIGSTVEALLTVGQPKEQDLKHDSLAGIQKKEPLSKQKMHRKVLDKGKPDDVMAGIKNIQESLPLHPLSGMLNKHGGKVRLTFKLEVDQLWLSTKERTEKIPMGSIKGLVSEAIEGEDQYHIMGIQLGPTEASRYWVYWVPAQYVNAVYLTILGRPYSF